MAKDQPPLSRLMVVQPPRKLDAQLTLLRCTDLEGSEAVEMNAVRNLPWAGTP